MPPPKSDLPYSEEIWAAPCFFGARGVYDHPASVGEPFNGEQETRTTQYISASNRPDASLNTRSATSNQDMSPDSIGLRTLLTLLVTCRGMHARDPRHEKEPLSD